MSKFLKIIFPFIESENDNFIFVSYNFEDNQITFYNKVSDIVVIKKD